MEVDKPGLDIRKKVLILKIGTSTLSVSSDRISYAKIEDIARQIISLRDKFHVILVSSGAIATARQFVDLTRIDLEVDSKQALAAIGQPKLMTIYDEVFSSFGLKVAQCLLVHRDFQSEVARTNVRSTLNKLLEFGYTPIINENDTVAVDEIVLGDNDRLSAMVAEIIQADLLVLASDIDGLYDQNPHLNKEARLIREVSDLEEVRTYIDERTSTLGTGGMTTKIEAARICKTNRIEMWIVNGGRPNFLVDVLENRIPFTKFV